MNFLINSLSSSQPNTDLTPMDIVEPPRSFNDLSFELICLIFFNLNITELARCAQVNKRWSVIANDPFLLKPIIYRDLTFSNRDWEHCFGEDVLAGEENKNDFDSLPDDIGKILKSPCPVFPGKRVGQTHMLVRIFKDLTFRILGELVREKRFHDNPIADLLICNNILDQHGDKASKKSYWVLMTKDIIPGSRWMSFATQEQMVASIDVNCPAKSNLLVESFRSVVKYVASIFNPTSLEIPQEPAAEVLRGYEVPTTLEAVACMLVWYFKFRGRLFSNSPSTCTRCKEKTLESNGLFYRNVVGGLASGGVRVFFNFAHDRDYVGVVGSRKFWP